MVRLKQTGSLQGLLAPHHSLTVVFQRRCKPRTSAKAGHTVAFKNFGDDLLDYIEAGPKLRKWYGEGERRPREGGRPEPEEEEKLDGPANSILVTEADSPTGELILLQLILLRLKVTALVKDVAAAQQAYGEYIKPIQGRVGDEGSLRKALRSAHSVICLSKLGALPQLLPRSQARHVVLLSCAGGCEPGFLGKLLGGELATLADPAREEALEATGVPLTVVRVGKIMEAPGGTTQLSCSQAAASDGRGEISREDVAQVLVRALQKPPVGSLKFEVSSQRTGQATQWATLFAGLRETPTAQPLP